MLIITINDSAIRAKLAQISALGKNPQVFLMKIAENITERTRRRFITSTSPEGAPWLPNAPSTLENFLRKKFAGKPTHKKNGQLTKAVSKALAQKKPLIGLSPGNSGLRATIFYQADGQNAVIIGTPKIYAATQQFGRAKGASGQTTRGSPIPWGAIPARPFLPVTPAGAITPTEQKIIIADFEAYLRESLK